MGCRDDNGLSSGWSLKRTIFGPPSTRSSAPFPPDCVQDDAVSGIPDHRDDRDEGILFRQ